MAGQAMAQDILAKKNWRLSLPSPAYLISMPLITAYRFGVPWCFATATMMATVLLRRELKISEAWESLGGCVVPVLGGLVMQELFKHHPEWDTPQPTVKVDRFGIGGQ